MFFVVGIPLLFKRYKALYTTWLKLIYKSNKLSWYHKVKNTTIKKYTIIYTWRAFSKAAGKSWMQRGSERSQAPLHRYLSWATRKRPWWTSSLGLSGWPDDWRSETRTACCNNKNKNNSNYRATVRLDDTRWLELRNTYCLLQQQQHQL